jgi:hypothetical protein
MLPRYQEELVGAESGKAVARPGASIEHMSKTAALMRICERPPATEGFGPGPGVAAVLAGMLIGLGKGRLAAAGEWIISMTVHVGRAFSL